MPFSARFVRSAVLYGSVYQGDCKVDFQWGLGRPGAHTQRVPGPARSRRCNRHAINFTKVDETATGCYTTALTLPPLWRLGFLLSDGYQKERCN